LRDTEESLLESLTIAFSLALSGTFPLGVVALPLAALAFPLGATLALLALPLGATLAGVF